MGGQLSRIGPVAALLVVLIVGALLGYLWAAAGVEIKDTGLWQLHPSYQGIYVQAVADAYASDGDEDRAITRLSFLCQQNDGLNVAFQDAVARYGPNANLADLQALAQSGRVQSPEGVRVCSTTSPNPPLPGFIPVAGLVLVGLAIVGYGVMRIIRVSEEEGVVVTGAPAPAGERARPTLPSFGRKKPEESAETVRSAAQAGARLSAAAEKTDYMAVGETPPVIQFMTTYLQGDDLYDDSFSIETPAGEFLGETGIGISETLGTGGPKNVTAFEVWLFDKNDIRTVTKVLMSDHAYNDDAIRARLAPKGEAVRVEPDLRANLETASLRVQARIVDVSYASGSMPPNSVFDRITIELAAWKRDGSGGGPPMATPSRANLPGSTPPGGSPTVSG